MLKRRMGDSSARSNTFRLRALESRVGKPKGAGAVRGNRGSVESSKHFQNITSKYVSEFGNRHNAFLDSLGSGKGFSYSVAVASAFVQKLNASKVVEENNLGKTIVNLADKLGVDRAIALAHQASNMYQAFNRYAQVNSSIDTQGMFPHAPALIVETVILNYVNKVSDQIVPEVTMTSMNQRIVFLDATYGTAYNDVKEGQKLVEYVGRFGATELREIPFADARIVKTNNTTITATLLSNEFSGNLPIVPNTIMFVVKGLVVGRDNGVGGVLNAEGNSLLSVKSGTVDYKTGATTVTFGVSGIPNDDDIDALVVKLKNAEDFRIRYHIVSEDVSAAEKVQTLDLVPRSYDFEVRQFPVFVENSVFAKLFLSSVNNVDLDKVLSELSSSALIRTFDSQLINSLIGNAQRSPSIAVDFAEMQKQQAANVALPSVSLGIDKVNQSFRDSLQRGGVSKILATSDMNRMFSYQNGFQVDKVSGKSPMHRFGTDVNGTAYFTIPTKLMTEAGFDSRSVVCLYEGSEHKYDCAAVTGMFLPLYKSDTVNIQMREKRAYAMFACQRLINPDYIKVVKFNNMPSV